MGFPAPCACRGVTGNHPAPGARRQSGRADRDEVSGAGSAGERGRLRAHGRRLRKTPLRQQTGGATLHSLARGLARRSRAHPRRARTVPENAAASCRAEARGSRTGRARSGDGACHSPPCRPKARRSSAGDERRATGPNATLHGKRPPGTQPDGGTNRKGTGNTTC